MPEPEVITNVCAMREVVQAKRALGKTIGVVPTMGALHAGHLSLVKKSIEKCDVTVVTIFVNPTQFNEKGDFDRYPQDLNKDLSTLAHLPVDYVFAPTTDSIYPPEDCLTIDVGRLGRILEGRFRPGHFAGVATVLLKLFHIIPADTAFFGEKDYQQLKVTERLVRDSHLPIRIEACPTIREEDGLAMSSRNRFLPEDARENAQSIYLGLQHAQCMVDSGETETEKIIQKLRQQIQTSGGSIEYVAIVDPETLEPVQTIRQAVVALVAIRIDSLRLIDNLLLQPKM